MEWEYVEISVNLCLEIYLTYIGLSWREAEGSVINIWLLLLYKYIITHIMRQTLSVNRTATRVCAKIRAYIYLYIFLKN